MIDFFKKILIFLGIVKKDNLSERLLEFVKKNKGKIFCTDYEYGSHETINKIIEIVTGKQIFKINSTNLMCWFMDQNKKRFKRIFSYIPGDIIISPTSNNVVGNVGIVGENDVVFSNNHLNGKLDDHLKIKEWELYYKKQNIPTYFFRIK